MNKIRLIELFSGIGAQASALDRLGVNYESWITSEWEVNAVASYKAIHKPHDKTDYSKEYSIEEVTNYLVEVGISTDGKNPMTRQQIERKNEKWRRTVYNNFMAINNIGSIVNADAADLEIYDTESYTYLLTYSFPCQDLSVAGKGAGMSKGSGTRSGLLWEIERLLNECTELPQILLMENVPQVHGKNNIEDFNKWLEFLESKGYHNYWKDLNAKDYGVAQNRNRCFMISLLMNVPYHFPEPIPLTKRMKDYLEDEVNEKYYINNEKADALIKKLIVNGELKSNKEPCDLTINDPSTIETANCIKARYDAGISNFKQDGSGVIETVGLKNKGTEFSKKIDVAHTLLARDYKGMANTESNGVIECQKK